MKPELFYLYSLRGWKPELLYPYSLRWCKFERQAPDVSLSHLAGSPGPWLCTQFMAFCLQLHHPQLNLHSLLQLSTELPVLCVFLDKVKLFNPCIALHLFTNVALFWLLQITFHFRYIFIPGIRKLAFIFD